jgi:hypothetical protein
MASMRASGSSVLETAPPFCSYKAAEDSFVLAMMSASSRLRLGTCASKV